MSSNFRLRSQILHIKPRHEVTVIHCSTDLTVVRSLSNLCMFSLGEEEAGGEEEARRMITTETMLLICGTSLTINHLLYLWRTRMMMMMSILQLQHILIKLKLKQLDTATEESQAGPALCAALSCYHIRSYH